MRLRALCVRRHHVAGFLCDGFARFASRGLFLDLSIGKEVLVLVEEVIHVECSPGILGVHFVMPEMFGKMRLQALKFAKKVIIKTLEKFIEIKGWLEAAVRPLLVDQ